MTTLRKLSHFMGFGGGPAVRWTGGFSVAQRVAPADQAALRLFSLPRGFRQRSRCFLLDV